MFGKSHIDYDTDRGLGETYFGTETGCLGRVILITTLTEGWERHSLGQRQGMFGKSHIDYDTDRGLGET